MDYRYVGDIVNTHGIKGEVKIISKIKFKKLIFKKNTILYIGDSKECVTISSYRVHKGFDMVSFDSIDSINDVLKFKGKCVFVDKNMLDDSVYFNEDLIGAEIYQDNILIGIVDSIINNSIYDMFVVTGKGHGIIPNISNFVKSIDVSNNRIDVSLIGGMISED